VGSYSELWLGSFYLGSVKNAIDPLIMTIFRESDKRIAETTRAQLRLESFDVDELEENKSITLVQYACSAPIARDRLELIGFTHEIRHQNT